jgi:predicted nucleotidyltransferase
MDKYKKKWTLLEQGVFELLSKKAGEKLSQRDIAKIVKASPTAVGQAIKTLGELVKVEKTKTINFISLNRDNTRAIWIKRAENLKSVYESGLLPYLETELAGSCIILFGSYSQGMDISSSDIDIAIIGRKDKMLNLQEFEKNLQRTVNINFYDSFKSIRPHLKNNILSGIVLSGGVEL